MGCTKVDVRKSRSACTLHVTAKRQAGRLNTCTLHVPPCFISLNVSYPFVSRVQPCFISLHVSHPTFHVQSCFISTCFTHLIFFTSHHVLLLCTFEMHSCFISLHLSHSTMFYLSARFKSIRVLVNSLCMFQVPPRFIPL